MAQVHGVAVLTFEQHAVYVGACADSCAPGHVAEVVFSMSCAEEFFRAGSADAVIGYTDAAVIFRKLFFKGYFQPGIVDNSPLLREPAA